MKLALGPNARRIAGGLGLSFYVARAAGYLISGEPWGLLWSCHLATLAIGFGLLFSMPTLNAVGLLWVSVGLPAWVLDLATGGVFHPTSILTHVGGLALGLLGVATLGLPPGAWWKALAGFAGLQLLTRLVSPPDANVNLAFAVWTGWESWFSSHASYLAFLSAVNAFAFLGMTFLLRKTGVAPSPAHST